MEAQYMSPRIWAPVMAGLLVHQCIFAHGEWHLQAPKVLVSHIILFAGVAVFGCRSAADSIFSGFGDSLRVVSMYCFALFTSMTIRRLFFHRLGRFPGPVMARVTKLWHLYHCLDSRNHLLLDSLHKQYGEFVRTGPSELAVFHPGIHQAIDGLGSTCRKAAWYDNLFPDLSLVSIRDRKVHDERRRVWDRAFGQRSLMRYEERMQDFLSQLERYVATKAEEGTAVNVTNLFYWFAWDVMGDVVFGKHFGMLENEEFHIAVVMLRKAMDMLGPFTPVPWLAHIGFNLLPQLPVIKDWFAMMAFCHKRIDERSAQSDMDKLDISSTWIEEAKKNGMTSQDTHWLHGDAVLSVLAGSDTAAATLVFLFYRLAKDSLRAEKLYQEVSNVDTHNPKALQSLSYLNSVVNETLRLHPVLLTGGLRETPPGGIAVDGTYIPGHTTIVAPRFTTSRLESCFDKPDDFIPERWHETPEMVKDKRTFVPFGVGRFNCIGKQLGLSELRFITASLVKSYSVRFAPEEHPDHVVMNLKDTFTPSPGQLKLVFTKR